MLLLLFVHSTVAEFASFHPLQDPSLILSHIYLVLTYLFIIRYYPNYFCPSFSHFRCIDHICALVCASHETTAEYQDVQVWLSYQPQSHMSR